jgi:hypothetical protein
MLDFSHLGLVQALAALFQFQAAGLEKRYRQAILGKPPAQYQPGDSCANDADLSPLRSLHRKLFQIDIHGPAEDTKIGCPARCHIPECA